MMKLITQCLLVYLLLSVLVRSTPLTTFEGDDSSVLVKSISLDTLEGDDLRKPTAQMIADEGYPVETHWVTTLDGYRLCLHRIPTGKNGTTNKKVAFLMHGILTSSSDWILFGGGKGLGYILADEGYDVWMGNARGNVYSRNHTKYNPDKDSAFWQFSWNEIGEIDLPTMIDYVLSQTRVDGVYYAGHSQGTTSFFVMTSQKPEYNNKIKVQASLAPIAYMKHAASPLVKIAVTWEHTLEELLKLIGLNEFLPSYGFVHMLMEGICTQGVGPILCDNVLFALCGFSPAEMNLTSVPLVMCHTPAGASTKQFLHYVQAAKSGKFRKYDFGLAGNLKKYGTTYPPDYDLKKITAPVFLFYSKNDWMAGVQDVERLFEDLGNVRGKILVPEQSFNHLDYTYGVNAPKYVYRNVVDIFSCF